MEFHSRITIFSHPIVWLRDKCNNGLNQKSIYFLALLPTLPIIYGLIADWHTISGAANDQITALLAKFLFFYGLINLILIIVLQKVGVRLGRERTNYRILHKKVVEKIREYHALKKYYDRKNGKMDAEKIQQHIRDILTSFNDNYMKRLHGQEVSASIKYYKNEKLYPIRVGGDIARRSHQPEEVKKAYVYLALSEPGKKLTYIYVKDLGNLDKYESRVLGKYMADIQKRSQTYYNTFIALPIRGGKLQEVSGDFAILPDFGILGFDLKEKYGFGNFEPQELDFIACLADLLSEPLQDLIEHDIINLS